VTGALLSPEPDLRALASAARAASRVVAKATAAQRRAALDAIAAAVRAQAPAILAANQRDLAAPTSAAWPRR
jgi:glutamate-5-semialdehyde dehydrogenase